MLIPRFTLRTGLIWLSVGAVVAVVLREALAQKPWAISVSVALGVVVLSLLVQAAAFVVSLLLSRGADRGETP